jgi:hypothetical protein
MSAHHLTCELSRARIKITTLAFVCMTITFGLHATAHAQGFVPQDGDIVFHQSTSSQSEAIKLVTRSKYTHMGVVFHVGGEPMVLEAIAKVSWTPYEDWVARGVDGHVVVKRLKEETFSSAQLEAMRKVGVGLKGVRYDVKFLWSDETMYCSELVWKIYERGADITLVEPQRYSDFDLSNPKVKRLVKARFGEKAIPLEELVVSPASLHDSALLVTVFETP